MTMRFFGQWDFTLDPKGRISIPARFRKELKDGAVVTLSPDGCLQVYPQEEAEELPPSQIWKVEADGQGRISIPRKLIQSLSFGKKVTWFGQGDYLEVRPQEPKGVIEAIRNVLEIVEREISRVIGEIIPYGEITIAEGIELHSQGIAVVCDGDKKAAVLQSDN